MLKGRWNGLLKMKSCRAVLGKIYCTHSLGKATGRDRSIQLDRVTPKEPPNFPPLLASECYPQTIPGIPAIYYHQTEEWKRVQLEWLLAALVDSKVVAMKADSSYMQFHQGKVKAHRLPIHHELYHHRCRHKEKWKKSAMCKVHQWDDGSAMVSDERYVTLDMVDEDYEMARRKKRKKRRNVGPMLQRPPILTKPKVVDPEDLPKRARWTIIITAGFLLLTCMLLVGITLRMAPIIDQMVHSQNEELMNSLNRQSIDYNGTMLMA